MYVLDFGDCNIFLTPPLLAHSEFTLKSDKKASVQNAGRRSQIGASYRRSQLRRREAYLEKKSGNPPEKGGEGVLGLAQEERDQQDTGEHNNTSLDLDPTT